MFCKTKHDQGLIEVPAITPHLEVFTFDDAELGITADTPAEALREVNFAFYIDALGNGQGLTGRLTRDMLRLVDGVRSRNEIVAALTARGYDAMEINTKFANLAYRFALVSAEHHLPPARAALFSALGITPRRAEECLAELQIHIIDLSAHAQAAAASSAATGPGAKSRPSACSMPPWPAAAPPMRCCNSSARVCSPAWNARPIRATRAPRCRTSAAICSPPTSTPAAANGIESSNARSARLAATRNCATTSGRRRAWNCSAAMATVPTTVTVTMTVPTTVTVTTTVPTTARANRYSPAAA